MGRKTHGPYLIAAIEYNDVEKVSEILVKQFRDRRRVCEMLVSEIPRLVPEHTEIPLLLAASLPDPAILRYFSSKFDINVNHVFESGSPRRRKKTTALLVAVRQGNYDTVAAILSLNGDVNFADHKGRRPLHHAIRRADYRMTKMLLSHGAQSNAPDVVSNTPLHVATIYGHTELVKLLLQNGADVYKKGQHGAIAIHIAAHEGHANLVRLFCQFSEVNPNTKVPCYDHKDKAPLHVAAERGHSETVFTLLEHCGAGVDVRDSEGETPLHCAVINEYDQYGMKSKEDYTETAKLLLNYGADPNVRNARGETPMHLAARNEFQKIVEVLVLAGCDPIQEDNDGNKAIDLASDSDTVSQQTIRHATTERERYMNESMEVRARGFATVTQRQAALPLAVRSPSLLSMPLLMGAAPSLQQITRAASTPGLFASPPHSSMMSFGYMNGDNGGYLAPLGSQNQLAALANMSGMMSPVTPPRNMSSNMNITGYSPVGSLQRQNSVPLPIGASEIAAKTSPMHNMSMRSRQGSIAGSDTLTSVTDPRSIQPPVVPTKAYARSENSSLWNVTPASSNILSLDGPEPAAAVQVEDAATLRKQRRMRKVPKDKMTVTNGKTGPPTLPKKQPLVFQKPRTVSPPLPEEEFSDGYSEDSFDTISEKTFETNSTLKTKSHQSSVQRCSDAKNNMASYGSQASLRSWLEEQAEVTKKGLSKTVKSDASDKHMTYCNLPPPERPPKLSRTSSSSSTETVKRRAPPPVPAKIPESPGKHRRWKKKSKDDNSGRSSSANPPELVERVIEVEIDETQVPGQTVFRVVPVCPPGPPKARVVSRKVANEAISHLDEDSFVDSLSVSNFSSLSDTLSAISGEVLDTRTFSDVSSIPASGKNSKKWRLVQRINEEDNNSGARKNKRNDKRHWEKIPLPMASAAENDERLMRKSVKELKKRQKDEPPAVADARVFQPIIPTAAIPEAELESADEDTFDSSEWTDDESLDNQLQQQQEVDNVRPFEETFRSEPSGLISPPPYSMPSSFTPGQLAFQRVTSPIQDDFPDSITNDYMFHRSIAELTSASADDIVERVGKTMDGNPNRNSLSNSDTSSISGVQQLSPGMMGTGYPADQLFQYQMNGVPSPAQLMQMEMQRQQAILAQHQQYQQQLAYNQQLQMQALNIQQQQQASNIQQRHQQQQQWAVQNRSGENSHPGISRVRSPTEYYEQIPEESSEKHVSVSSDDLDPSYGRNIRTVSYRPSENPGFLFCGGNVSGTFVASVVPKSAATDAGLNVGDLIIAVNRKVVKNRSKDEIMHLLQRSSDETLSLVVGRDDDRFRLASAKNAVGDSFHVRAHFSCSPPNSKGKELSVKEGDIFVVSDSLPEDHVGFWIAKRVSGNASEPEGLIPNSQKAEQIVIKQRLLASGGDKQRGGSIMRSFRRSKSVDRSAAKDSMDSRRSSSDSGSDILVYERVIQKSLPTKRPVVLMGLFCDAVCAKLAKDSPGIYEVPSAEVEQRGGAPPTEEFSSSMLNIGVIRGIVNRGRHCLMVVSPRAVQFLREKTELKPILIYLSPVSKNILKAVKDQLAPSSDKKARFLFEEAAKFEKFHAGLFDAIVPYKVDGSWLGLLKDTVDRFQRHPQWITYDVEDRFLEHGGSSPDLVKTTRIGKTEPKNDRRISRTTDDIPDQIQDLLSRHLGVDFDPDRKAPLDENVINTDSRSLTGNNNTRSSNRRPPKSILKNVHNRSLSTIDFDAGAVESSGSRRRDIQLTGSPVAVKPPRAASGRPGGGSGVGTNARKTTTRRILKDSSRETPL